MLAAAAAAQPDDEPVDDEDEGEFGELTERDQHDLKGCDYADWQGDREVCARGLRGFDSLFPHEATLDLIGSCIPCAILFDRSSLLLCFKTVSLPSVCIEISDHLLRSQMFNPHQRDFLQAYEDEKHSEALRKLDEAEVSDTDSVDSATLEFENPSSGEDVVRSSPVHLHCFALLLLPATVSLRTRSALLIDRKSVV